MWVVLDQNIGLDRKKKKKEKMKVVSCMRDKRREERMWKNVQSLWSREGDEEQEEDKFVVTLLVSMPHRDKLQQNTIIIVKLNTFYFLGDF